MTLEFRNGVEDFRTMGKSARLQRSSCAYLSLMLFDKSNNIKLCWAVPIHICNSWVIKSMNQFCVIISHYRTVADVAPSSSFISPFFFFPSLYFFSHPSHISIDAAALWGAPNLPRSTHPPLLQDALLLGSMCSLLRALRVSMSKKITIIVSKIAIWKICLLILSLTILCSYLQVRRKLYHCITRCFSHIKLV